MAGALRVTGGRLVRRRLQVPRAADKGDVRPTTDRVREALFSSLAARGALDGARVLDLFAGSGALGIEALSRGAQAATFVERAREVIAVLRRNLRELGLEAEVLERDAARALGKLPDAAFDLVLADPPYARAIDEAWLTEVARVLAPGGLLVLERAARDQPPPALDGLPLSDERVYGSTKVFIYELEETE
jgi:16S rRNA (guanine966-N2)-methyltransferase